jgi:hypothetical protein
LELSDRYATLLSASRTLISLLRVLNIGLGLAIIVALGASFVFEPVFRDFFTTSKPRIDPRWLMPTLRLWMVLVAPMFVATHILLTRMREMVDTVRAGDPFVAANADRLKTIAWCMLALQAIRMTFGLLAGTMNAAGSSVPWDFSLGSFLTGWLSVLLAFVLAQVFAEGARIRDDLEAMI